MDIDCISDLHGYMPDLPGGADVLIIGGDCTARDTSPEWRSFAKWVGRQDYKHVILVGGNHDWGLMDDAVHVVLKYMPDNVIYLEDEGVVIDGVSFWGSPWTCAFLNWAFMLPRNGPELKAVWDKIPQKVDVLITHGPAYGILDTTARGDSVGCELLREAIFKRDIKFHLGGHIHECGTQTTKIGGTTFMNVSYVKLNYTPWKENYIRRIEL